MTFRSPILRRPVAVSGRRRSRRRAILAAAAIATGMVTAATTAPAGATTFRHGLGPNTTMYRNDTLVTNNGRCFLAFQWDQNVVIYDRGTPIWARSTVGSGADRLVMQGDGNFVLYRGNTPIWHTNTWGRPGAAIYMQDDCNLVIYHSGRAVWASNTARAPLPAPAPTPGGSVFYAGLPSPSVPDGYDYATSATVRRRLSQWAAGNCDTSWADDGFAEVVADRRITTLAGFSLGRLGPVYFLHAASANRVAPINRIVMFDPGNADDLYGGCDRSVNASRTLATWLRNNPDAKLIILAGKRTAQNRHQGIQDVYFAPAIRGQSIASRVIVCNLDTWEHADVIKGYHHFIGSPPDRCPAEYHQWSP